MYKEILLPIDLNDENSWRKALPCALKLAKAFGARLHIMTVVPDFGMSIVANYFPKGYEKKALEHATAALHDFTKKHLPKGTSCQHIVAHGTVYEEILKLTPSYPGAQTPLAPRCRRNASLPG